MTHTIVFHDPQGYRMPGARCMIYERGRPITSPTAAADAFGELRLELSPHTESLHVEWCPAALPTREGLPYQKRYHAALGEQPSRRRLANLGFATRPRLDDNVRDYQQATGQAVTGHERDIVEDLRVRHDEGGLTPFTPQPEVAPATAVPGNDALAALFRDPTAFDGTKRHALSGSPAPRAPEKAKQGPGGDKPSPSGTNRQGAVVPNVGHLWLVVGLEPEGATLDASALTVRLWPKDRAASTPPTLVKPTLVGAEWGALPNRYVLCVFQDVPAGQYSALAHAGNVADVSRRYALGAVEVAVRVGILTLAYLPVTRDRAILTADDPLLELDVEVMQRRRKVLAMLHVFFPQSADPSTAPPNMPPYDQGRYQQMLKGLDATNTCAPINVLAMTKAGAVGTDFGFNQVIVSQRPNGSWTERVPAAFVEYRPGQAPSVGDSFLGTDGRGLFHHCGVVVRSSSRIGDLWLTADGGQPDRTSPFEPHDGQWRRRHDPPPSREGAYVVPRLLLDGGSNRLRFANRFIFPGSYQPAGDFIRGWTDITHPSVRFQAAYTADITESDFRAFQKRLRGIDAKARADIKSAQEKEKTRAPTPAE